MEVLVFLGPYLEAADAIRMYHAKYCLIYSKSESVAYCMKTLIYAYRL